ncbi:hypothetical protein [uncultured Corynebacterium sp.]|uniref:hypothetical protein n=1 Tax=uncultured Corynebacterium sp. TaxID=159447 RepID=UPI0025E2F6FE|nr:hypothetical protein [uncultured Corynebacterium sp.]
MFRKVSFLQRLNPETPPKMQKFFEIVKALVIKGPIGSISSSDAPSIGKLRGNIRRYCEKCGVYARKVAEN